MTEARATGATGVTVTGATGVTEATGVTVTGATHTTRNDVNYSDIVLLCLSLQLKHTGEMSCCTPGVVASRLFISN